MVAKSIEIGTGALLPYEPASRKLIIEWAPAHLHVLLWNTNTSGIEALESYSGAITDEEEWERVLGQSRLLPLTNVEAWLYSAGPRLLPVPAPMYEADKARAEMDLLLGKVNWHHSMADLVPEHDMVLAWQIPSEVINWLQQHFSVLSSRHILGELLKKPSSATNAFAQMIMGEKEMLVILHDQMKLLYVGALPLHTADDLSYRLLNLCRQFNLQADDVSWQVSGMIEKEATLYKGLERFLLHLELWPAPFELSEGVSPHYFAHLFSLLS